MTKQPAKQTHQNEQNPLAFRQADVTIAPRLQVDGDKVFVHKKLTALLSAQRKDLQGDESSLSRHPIESLMEMCWVPAIEAVRKWAVMPEGIVIAVDESNDGYVLFQNDFKCVLPGLYASVGEAQEAAARIIKGQSLSGPGTLSYRGQIMTPLKTIDLSLLPKQPTLLSLTPVDASARSRLDGVRFREGFALLERPLFQQINEVDAHWEGRMSAMHRYVLEREYQLKEFFMGFDATILSDFTFPLMPGIYAGQLHMLYPELSKLDELTINSWVNLYCSEIDKASIASHQRDIGFLAFLVGEVVQPKPNHAGAFDAGWATLFAWMIGTPLQDAMHAGRLVEEYGRAIDELVRHVIRIMARLERDALTLGEPAESIGLHNRLRAIFSSGSNSVH